MGDNETDRLRAESAELRAEVEHQKELRNALRGRFVRETTEREQGLNALTAEVASLRAALAEATAYGFALAVRNEERARCAALVRSFRLEIVNVVTGKREAHGMDVLAELLEATPNQGGK